MLMIGSIQLKVREFEYFEQQSTRSSCRWAPWWLLSVCNWDDTNWSPRINVISVARTQARHNGRKFMKITFTILEMFHNIRFFSFLIINLLILSIYLCTYIWKKIFYRHLITTISYVFIVIQDTRCPIVISELVKNNVESYKFVFNIL